MDPAVRLCRHGVWGNALTVADQLPNVGLSKAAQSRPNRARYLRKRSASREATPEADSEPSHKLPRPTLLLPRPQPIRVFAVAPQGHPHRFESGGRERQVVESWGPERLETGWWRGPSLRRDYFRVLIADGRRCWLFRELRTGRWFLHGWFD